MPKTVAVVGASNDRHKFGNKALRAFQAEGHTVIPINPHDAQVEGLNALMAEAARRGLNVIYACSIVAIGRSPAQFP